MKPIALIVDDEPDIRELLSLTLERMDIATREAEDLEGARSLLDGQRFDLCLTDMRLPDGNGLDLVEWMQDHAPQVPVAVITAHGNVESAVRALKVGAFDFVSKPLDLGDLRRLVAQALRLRGDERGRERAREADRLLGESPAIGRVRELIRRVARSQAPVHICGESGTGKELVAQMIHEASPRREGPFVPVNCGAVPTELMESEFFGHRKGAFTGAVSDKPGLFQTAEGGTLFLDEVADLPLHMQVKLLRAIQEKAVRPVGETDELPVDVRVLSATHKDLARLVADGIFREDLYYRINVIELRVPPLRERGDDVLLIARHLLGRLAAEMDMDPPVLTKAAERALLAYAFPGNVRELENTLERAVALCMEGLIDAGDLELRAARPTAVAAQPVAAAAAAGGALGEQLQDIERDAILQALEQTRYNKTAAAKLLGISFRALRYRIKKLGLE